MAYKLHSDALEDYLANAPDEELLEAARGDGRNPADTTARVKSVLMSAVNAFQQRESERRPGISQPSSSPTPSHPAILP